MLLPRFRTKPDPVLSEMSPEQWIQLDPTQGFTTRDFAVADALDDKVEEKFRTYLEDSWPMGMDFAKTGGTFVVEYLGTPTYDLVLLYERVIASIYKLAQEDSAMPVFIDAMLMAKMSSERSTAIDIHGERYSYFDFLTKECDFLCVRNFQQLGNNYAHDMLASIVSSRLGKKPLTLLIQTGPAAEFHFLYSTYNHPFVCNVRKAFYDE